MEGSVRDLEAQSSSLAPNRLPSSLLARRQSTNRPAPLAVPDSAAWMHAPDSQRPRQPSPGAHEPPFASPLLASSSSSSSSSSHAPYESRGSGSDAYPLGCDTPPISAPGGRYGSFPLSRGNSRDGLSGGGMGKAGRGRTVLGDGNGGNVRTGGGRPVVRAGDEGLGISSPRYQGDEHAYGLGLDVGGGLLPLRSVSPRTGRRQYPGDHTPSPSPSPRHSPTARSFLTLPHDPHSNAYLPTTVAAPSEALPQTLRRQASATILATLSGIGPGLVRRVSSSSLREELPTSVTQTSGTPVEAPASPLLGFAGKAREDESWLRERRREKRVEQHDRRFSWAERSEDLMELASRGKGVGWRKGIVVGTLVVALTVVFASWTGEDRTRKPPRAILRHSKSMGETFIHPDVVFRSSSPPRSSHSRSRLDWIGQLLPFKRTLVEPINTRRQSRSVYPSVTAHHHFVASTPVPFLDHTALPPPLLHSEDSERDTLVLYRILGNDLPPRHSPGQTLRNLRFLLQYESDFSSLPHLGPHQVHHATAYGSGSKAKRGHSSGGGLRVDKYFILNRIAEPDVMSAIIGLLHLYSVPNSRILIIPFEWEEYQTRPFRWDGGVDKILGWGIGPQDEGLLASVQSRAMALSAITNSSELVAEEEESQGQLRRRKRSELLIKLRALDFTYHEKNLYAMNNNGGRNFALEHGRSLKNARWILPLDGNSFFTPAAMDSIVRTLSISGEGPTATRYLVIPMARTFSNDEVLSTNSISFVPSYPSEHNGTTAIEDAELHHVSDAAPLTPDEPQIGFRYDSTESFQEAMRYGRRSKLELLWRLGAIPYSRALDRRTLPWETSDRDHVTSLTWASIPGAPGTVRSESIVHRPHGDFIPWSESDPTRGPLAFTKAGWVYRLFSGDKSQEGHSREAITLRSINRIKGIVAFLERLDEKVARGLEGCYAEETSCGFSKGLLWSFENDEMERLRQQYKIGMDEAEDRVKTYEGSLADMTVATRRLVSRPEAFAREDIQELATRSAQLAMAGYLTGNGTYSHLAASIIQHRFERPPSSSLKIQSESREVVNVFDDDVEGYAFPPSPRVEGETTWSMSLAQRWLSAEETSLPFDPLHFDPTLLLDALRLLSLPTSPRTALSSPGSLHTVNSILTLQLSHLLHSPAALSLSRSPSSRQEGVSYDIKVATLAAYFDDGTLLGRVANRARLRMGSEGREEGLMRSRIDGVMGPLRRGLQNVRFRPYSLVDDEEEEYEEGSEEAGEVGEEWFAELAL